MVAVLLEAIADTWVEDSNILLSSVSAPEWILSRKSTRTRTDSTRSRSTSGHPWAAHQDDNISVEAKNLFDAWSKGKARELERFKGIDALGSEVKVVRRFNTLDKFGCEFLSDEDGKVQIAETISHVLNSGWNDTASVVSDSALVSPEVSWMFLSDERINGGGWSSY